MSETDKSMMVRQYFIEAEKRLKALTPSSPLLEQAHLLSYICREVEAIPGIPFKIAMAQFLTAM